MIMPSAMLLFFVATTPMMPSASDVVADETIPLPQQITLDQAIDECLANSPDLHVAAEIAAQAEGDVQTASLLPNPSLLLLTSLQPFANHAFTPTRQGGPPQYDAALNWPVDWLLFGKRASRRRAALRGKDASQADYSDAVRTRVAYTVATFYAILEAEALAALAEENAANLSRVAMLTHEKVIQGGAAKVDEDRIQLAALSAQREARMAGLTVQAAKTQLRALLGRKSPAPDFEVIGTLEIQETSPTSEFAAAFTTAQAQRPDIAALKHRFAQAEAKLQLAQREAFPSLSLQGGATYQDQAKAIGYPGVPSWNLGLVMGLPLFDRNQGNIVVARAALREATWRLEAALIQLQAEVEQVLRSYDFAKVIATQDMPRQLEAAQGIRTRMREAYKEGGKTLLEILDSERAVLETSRLYVLAQVDYWRTTYRLNATLGGVGGR